MALTNSQISPSLIQHKRISPMDYGNADLVSQLLAATPSYFYNMSPAANTYLFSELLRSFLPFKKESCQQMAITRRSRKRNRTKDNTPLMYDSNTDKMQKTKESPKNISHKEKNDRNEEKQLNDTTITEILQHSKHKNVPLFSTTTTNNSDSQCSSVVLPPPPPIWYPPLYQPPLYGIDPLHFFIDLRVSGHIYDGKKSVFQSITDDQNSFLNHHADSRYMFKSNKHSSAFRTPQRHYVYPNDLNKATNRIDNKTGINYVLNNVQRIYKQLQDGITVKNHEEENKQQRVALEKQLYCK